MKIVSLQLLEFTKLGLGHSSAHMDMFENCNLNQLFSEAERQTVVGLVAEGLKQYGLFERCSLSEKMLWISITAQIESDNEKHRKVLGKTLEHLNAKKIPVVFMKGLVTGNRYSNPSRRQCGDIDFVVAEQNFDKTLEALDEIGEVDRSLIHEHHGMAFVDGVTLEPHFKVHNYQNPKVDNAMQRLFSKVFPHGIIFERIGNIDVPTFPPAFECAVLVGHMVNHVYAEGLGLRQVIDFMMFLDKKYAELNKDECLFFLKHLQMERAFRIFARICEKYLGLSEKLLNLSYTSKESAFADKLMEDIMRVGNFGRGENYLGYIKALRPIRSYLWVTSRCIMLGYLCPAEAKWWPVSKVRRFWWKNVIKGNQNKEFIFSKSNTMWKEKYFCEERFRQSKADIDRKNGTGLKKDDPRFACESDFGRVVFSSSCRRLHDKTQVFPLTNDDNLHSRLTHSMEVMNVGLSFALRLSKREEFLKHSGLTVTEAYRYLSAFLKTAGLVHDIGNPPFGHFGEESIKAYFSKVFKEIEDELENNDEKTNYHNPILNHIIHDSKGELIDDVKIRKKKIIELKKMLSSPVALDYTQFDGNAQGFRVLTKLQFLDDLCGLNLTFATLAATLKYPNTGGKEDSPVHKHKHGVFTTEKKYLERIANKCGMMKGKGEIIRHPLSYLMEAADSICYMTMDVEDGCSKRSWISFEDIQNEFKGVSEKIRESLPFLNPLEGRTRGQRFKKAVVDMRTQLLAYLIDKTIANFVSNIGKIEAGTYEGEKEDEGELVYDDVEKVGQHMMNITKKFILSQREIYSLEIAGDAILKGIMDCLVGLLFNNRKQYRERGKNFISRSIFLTTLQEHLIESVLAKEENGDSYFKEIANPTLKAEDVYENFDVYDLSVEERLRIIRDFVSGMTDKFALNFYQKLSGQKVS